MLPTWIIQIIFVVSLIGGAYWYYTSTQAKIAQLTENNATLIHQAEINKAAIEGLKSAVVYQEIAYNKLANKMGKAEEEKAKLINIFQEHDLKKLSIAKPNLIEGIINDGTKNAFSELESITDK